MQSSPELIEVFAKDPDQWQCTTSSSCKRSCLLFFITFQFAIICALCLTLRSFQNNIEPKILPNQNFYDQIWNQLPNKMERLNDNPIYQRFNISRKMVRPKINLLIIVSSAPRRSDRRTAIRETWWNDHKTNDKIKVVRKFFTDAPENSTEQGRAVLQEQKLNEDVIFQDLSGGVEFGKRFLYHMVWAMQNYDFDYFLRMDDDYFFCLERFLHELPMPMRPMYHWGYVHCLPNIVRPEESVILFSRDLVEKFLSQNPGDIKGHPWADQMIATWVQDLKLNNLYNHDNRLYHHPPLGNNVSFIKDQFKKVCRKYIGVHGSYPEHMRSLWKLTEGKGYAGVELDEYTTKCGLPQIFLWNVFTDKWKYKPKKLISDPKWDTYKQDLDKHVYVGRQEGEG